MLYMTPAEIQLRRGSLLYWARYSFTNRYDMTRELVPVRLLAKVSRSCRREDNGRFHAVRVLDPATGKIHALEPHFLIDPTRMKKP